MGNRTTISPGEVLVLDLARDPRAVSVAGSAAPAAA
jgi:hypothetical protein